MDSPEYEALIQCFPKLVSGIQQSPNDVTVQLIPSGILAERDISFLSNPINDDYTKAEKIVNIVVSQVKKDPCVFKSFLKALRDAGPWTKSTVSELELKFKLISPQECTGMSYHRRLICTCNKSVSYTTQYHTCGKMPIYSSLFNLF